MLGAWVVPGAKISAGFLGLVLGAWVFPGGCAGCSEAFGIQVFGGGCYSNDTKRHGTIIMVLSKKVL